MAPLDNKVWIQSKLKNRKSKTEITDPPSCSSLYLLRFLSLSSLSDGLRWVAGRVGGTVTVARRVGGAVGGWVMLSPQRGGLRK